MKAVKGCPRGPSTAVAVCEQLRVSGVGEGREKAGVMPPSERQLFLHRPWAPESSVMKPHNLGKELEGL